MMKQHSKKLLSLLLALVMCLSLFPVTALAEMDMPADLPLLEEPAAPQAETLEVAAETIGVSETFERISTVSAIEDGAEYVIYSVKSDTVKKAMGNTISGTANAVDVTESNGVITNPPAEAVWRFDAHPSDKDTFSIYNVAKKQYVVIGSDESKGISLAATPTYYFKATQGTNANTFFLATTFETKEPRSIALYEKDGTASFRSYNAPIADLYLYQKKAGPSIAHEPKTYAWDDAGFTLNFDVTARKGGALSDIKAFYGAAAESMTTELVGTVSGEAYKVDIPQSSADVYYYITATEAGCGVTRIPAEGGFLVNVATKPAKCDVVVAGTASGTAVLKGTGVTFTCATPGAELYYTATKDNTEPADPTSGSAKYDASVKIDAYTKIKVRAIHPESGIAAGDVLAVTYKIQAETPTFATGACKAVPVGSAIPLECASKGVELRYTLDGTTPTSASTKYTGPVELTELPKTLKVIAIDPSAAFSKMADSEVAEVAFTAGTPSTIANYWAKLSKQNGVLLSGIVTFIDGRNVTMQDSSNTENGGGGVYLSFDSKPNVGIGDTITVVGDSGNYNDWYGLTKNVVLLTKTDGNATNLPLPITVSLSDFVKLSGSKNKGLYESVRVKVEGLKLGLIDAKKSTDVSSFTDPTSSTIIYKGGSGLNQFGYGDVIDLVCVPGYYKTLQLRVAQSADITAAVDKYAPQFDFSKLGEPTADKDYPINVKVTDMTGVNSESITLSYTVKNSAGEVVGTPVTDQKIPTPEAATGIYRTSIPAARLKGGKTLELTFKGTATSQTPYSGTTNVTKTISDIPRVLTVTPEPGYSTGAVTKPEISVTFENGGAGSTATVKIDKAEPVAMTVTGSKATYTPASDLATGRHDIVVTITRADGAVGTRSWFFNVGDPTYQFYFGQLHSHTGQYSDGSGTLADGLNHLAGISDEDSVDFASFTDHSNYFDNKDKANPETALANTKDMTTESAAKWKQYKDDITAHNTAKGDTRRALAGFEMTWSGGPGHINTFNSNGIISRNNKALNNKAGDAGMKLYYETLKDPANAGTISQFNHPGTTFGTFSDFAYLDPIIDERINLIEVGNGEGAIGSGGYFPSYQYYIRALDKGWHLAPTNNQDNHKGNVGNGNTARSVVVSSAAMSEQTLLDGMKSMSMYATEDKNLEIMYTLNGLVMGSSTTETPGTVNIKATIKDPDATDKVGLVEVVANGGVVAASQSYASQTAEVSFDLPANYSYYFLRVTQPDRDIAVTAPVWIGSVPKVGISSITCPTLVPVAGEALDFTTTMYNLETEDYTISKLEYVEERLGKETVLKTETPSKIIGGVDHKDFAYSYTPSLEKLGFVTLIVRVTGTLGSTPMNLEQSYTFEVLDPATLTTIGIDGGHSNFYVTGNYNDSDAALVGMAGRSSVRAVRLAENELTYDKIKDMKMVILTVPFKEFGASVSDCVYTEAELNALKTYAENGGNFIITSKSDRGDPSGTGEQASVITNGILTAIGAKARVEKAIVIDPVRKANESYRITLGGDSAEDQKCFNYASKDPLAAKILNGVQRNTNNLFSAYNSAPIISNGAVPIVSGFPDTTWGTIFNTLDGDNKYAPTDASKELTAKGATHLITAETLTGGGFCIVSGVTFFSTFEVKPELDNATQKQNTNYQIVQNILDQVKPDSEPTAISEVHKAPEGTRFTIEGIATSNASGYDRSTAFFDCIYVQDKTGGINVFPVAGTIQEGQTVQVTGYTSSYNGERQLQATYYKVIDDAVNKVAPTAITTKQAASGDKLGALVSVTGVIASVKTAAGGEIESIMVRGADGYTARVFIDGYITSEKVIKDAVVGNDITAVGLVSHDTEGYRLRIRDRADIICTVPYNPAPRPKPVEPKPDAPVVEVKQEAAVGKDGTSASAAISNQDLNAALKNANKSGSTEIIISAALPKEGADKVTSLTVSLPSGALSSVAGNKNLDLTVATPSGSVTFGNEAVKALGKETNVAVCTAVAGADVTFTVSANGKPIEKLAGGFAAAVPAAKVTAGTVLMVVNADGTTTILPKSVADADTVKGLLDGNATLRVADNTKSFGDVAANHWGSSSVAFVSSHGLFQGTGEKLFSPEANTSRGMLITALYRLEGTPATKGEAPADVAKDSWYNQSAAWAKELGISNNDKLEGDREISRQELVTMAYRYAKAMKLDLTPTAKLDSFTDGDKVADWAKDAMSWAVSIGLVKGVPGGGLAPDDLASRAQISAIMERLVSYMVK